MAEGSEWANWLWKRMITTFEAEKTKERITSDTPPNETVIRDWFRCVHSAFEVAARELAAVAHQEFITVGRLEENDGRFGFSVILTGTPRHFSAECDPRGPVLAITMRVVGEHGLRGQRNWSLKTLGDDVWFDHEGRREPHISTDVAHFLLEFWLLSLASGAGFSEAHKDDPSPQ